MKKIIISLTLIISFLLVNDSFSQGLFEKQETEESSASSSSAPDRSAMGGLFRGRGDETENPGEKPTPIGEGFLILTALAGGYALIKNRKSNKQ